MTAELLEDVRVFLGGSDLALSLTKFEYATSTEEKDVTTFRSGTVAASTANAAKMVVGGLESSAVKLEGNSEAGSSDTENFPDDLFSDAVLERTKLPISFGPQGSAVGDVAYMANMLVDKLTTFGAPGDVWSYVCDGTAEATQRGEWIYPVTAVSASGTGTARELGAVAAGKKLYLCAHVLSTRPSASVVVEIESDSADTFLSPTSRIALTSRSSNGGELARTDGTAIADTFYRLKWTVTGGTSGSFIIVACAAIY